jgi:hypothetical protein
MLNLCLPWMVFAILVGVVWIDLNTRLLVPADTLWLSHAAQAMLSGQTLYKDVIETNPPMSVLLYAPACLLALLTGLSEKTAVLLQTIGAALASIAFTISILNRAGFIRPDRRAWAYALLSFCLLVAPNNQITQREHFALMFLLPAIAIAAARATAKPMPGWRARWAAGAMLGLAVAVKPHFALVPAILALVAASTTRSLRPILAVENLIAGVMLVAYWGLVFALFPAFWSEMWPILTELYLHERNDPATLLVSGHMALFIQIIAVLAGVTFLLAPSKRAALVWFAPALALLIVFLVQGKGFFYHLYPAAAMSAIAIGLLAMSQPFQSRMARPLTGVCCGLAIVVGTISQKENYPILDIVAKLRSFPAATPAIIVSESMQRSIFLADLAGLRWSSRLHTRWMNDIARAQLARRDATPAERARFERYLDMDRSVLLDDIESRRPTILAFDDQTKNWEAILRRDNRFEAAMKAYQFVGAYDHGRMTLYVRRDALDLSAGGALRADARRSGA